MGHRHKDTERITNKLIHQTKNSGFKNEPHFTPVNYLHLHYAFYVNIINRK